MASFWEAKYQSAEKSIQFVQNAHAEVLKGLHEEIEALQRQCAEFALKLSISAATSVEKEEFDKKFKSFNNEYKKKDAEIAEQRKQIEEKTKTIKALQERVKTLEKKLETECQAKDQTITQMKQKLEQQSNQIAQLTFQFHNMKKNNKFANHSSSLNEPTLAGKSSINPPNLDSIASSNHLNNSTESFHTAATAKMSSSNYAYRASDDGGENNMLFVPVPPLQTKPNHLNKSTRSRVNERRGSINSSTARKSPSLTKDLLLEHNSDLLNETSNTNNNINNTAATAANHQPSIHYSSNPHHSNRRSSSSSSNSIIASSELATPQLITHKILPPVIKRPADHMPPPDPKPFLLSAAASTLHQRVKKDLLQRKALVSLPPIKPFELNQLAVDSPFKTSHVTGSLDHNKNTSN